MSLLNEMSVSEMPYERCLKYGPEILTDTELLMILIRSGNRHNSCADIARNMLGKNTDGMGLLRVLNMSVKELKQIEGIGEVKAVQLASIMELSKRVRKMSLHGFMNFTNPENIADYYMEEMRYLRREKTKVLLLDTKCALIRDFDLSVGTVNTSLVSPREIFIEALKADAVNLVLLHNHPSGDPEPSRNDIDVTRRMARAGEMLGICLLDHIIIGDNRFVSLKRLGYIN